MSQSDHMKPRCPPLFEAGKTYRTRSGDLATIDDVDVAIPGFMIGHIKGGHHSWSWLLSGRINPDVPGAPDSPYDLMAGAVEQPPGPREVDDPEYNDLDGIIRITNHKGNMSYVPPPDSHENATDRLNKLEAQCSDIFRQLTNLRTNYNGQTALIAGLAARLDEFIERVDRVEVRQAQAVETQSNIIQRIAAVDNIQAEGRRSLANRLDEEIKATDTRLDRLSGIIDGMDKASQMAGIDLAARIAALSDRLDQGINDVNRRVDVHDKAKELAEAVSRLVPRTPRMRREAINHSASCQCSVCVKRDEARTIKGGWVNVYSGGKTSREFYPSQHDARQMDSTRSAIACIHIPDFTEGEGL